MGIQNGLTFNLGSTFTLVAVPDLSMSELARASGFTSSALRYYERVGLLTPTSRSAGGYRQYDHRAVERLEFIARAKRLGLHLDEITDLVSLWENGPCAPVQERLRELVDEKVASLVAQAEEHARFHAQLVHVRRSLESTEPADRCGPGCGCDTDWPANAEARISLRAKTPPARAAQPPVACTLAPDAMPGRLDEWQAVLARVEEREPVPNGIRLGFAPDADLLASLTRVAAKEVECCSFFSFALSLEPGAAWFTITAPADAQPLVAALFGGTEPVE